MNTEIILRMAKIKIKIKTKVSSFMNKPLLYKSDMIKRCAKIATVQ